MVGIMMMMMIQMMMMMKVLHWLQQCSDSMPSNIFMDKGKCKAF